MITKPFKAIPARISTLRGGTGILHTKWLLVALRLVGQCALLWLVFEVAGLLVQATQLPLPQNLVSLLLLLVLLTTGIVRPEQLTEISALVGKHLVFFFIPLVVGLMSWTDLLATHGLILTISIFGSALLGIGIAGLAAQTISRWNERSTRTSRKRQS